MAYEKIEHPADLPLYGVCVRKVGEFVGRRMDERVLSRELRGDKHAGVVIHSVLFRGAHHCRGVAGG